MCAVYQYKSKFLKPFLTPREFSNQTWLQKTVLWTLCWVKEASCTTLHTVGFHLWWSSWRGKPSLMLGEVKMVISSGRGRIQGRRSEQGHEAALWRDRNVLYLDLGGVHWTWVQNNSLSCRLPSYALHASRHTYGIPQRHLLLIYALVSDAGVFYRRSCLHGDNSVLRWAMWVRALWVFAEHPFLVYQEASHLALVSTLGQPDVLHPKTP